MATNAALSLLSRYEALFELTGEVNAATTIEGTGGVLARRLKYVADVFSWRYIRVEPERPGSATAQREALVIDGYRGEATTERAATPTLGQVEADLWQSRRARILEAEELAAVRTSLPPHLHKADIVQIYVCPRFGAGELESLFLFSKRRQRLSELDIKFLTLTAQLFHDKVSRQWEQEQRRALETAYLQQEIMLRQSEKLATLGRLSAGIAHEVNNPVAAALRNAEQLTVEIQRLEQGLEILGRIGLSDAQRGVLDRNRNSALELARQPPALDPLVCAQLESDVERWLDDHAVPEGWALAPTLVSMGFDLTVLSDLSASFTRDQLPAVLPVLAQTYAVHGLLAGIRTGTARVSEIVTALRSYSYLDQAPIQLVDVHEGLNNTLVMFHSKLKDGIAVRREFDPALPRIEAFGKELNQVWTNIIDNAVQAMEGKGELTLRTYVEEPWVVVEIADTGPGIPAEAMDHIFDPFFTTKPPGEGTGLGLNISHNIVVQRHGGGIDVRSQPGATRFLVRLPLKSRAPEPSAPDLSSG
jgi:signal transduction histidine kinase